MRPHLDDPRHHAPDRRALTGVTRGWLLFGLLLVAVALTGLVYTQDGHDNGLRFVAWLAMAIGLAVLAGVIAFRDRAAGGGG